jgi:hypothetical protein
MSSSQNVSQRTGLGENVADRGQRQVGDPQQKQLCIYTHAITFYEVIQLFYDLLIFRGIPYTIQYMAASVSNNDNTYHATPLSTLSDRCFSIMLAEQ